MTALHVHRYGAARGPALLALHGIRGHGARWRHVAETSLGDFSVIAPDLRGHGRSTHAPPWNTEAHVADMLAVLDAHGPDRVDLLGHSYGGLIALRLAHAAPERVGRMVLLDPSTGLPAGQMHDQARRTMSPGLFASPQQAEAERRSAWPAVSPAAVEEEIADHLVQRDDGRWQWRFEPAAVVTACSEMAGPPVTPPAGVPTLLVTARRSGFVSPAYVQACRATLGEQLTVAELDAGHMLYLENPEETGELIRRFLTRSPCRGGSPTP
ncbi:alpha/beta hydrolase [Streptomyces mashuensis]|uniref:Alpha/beta hydrolase n=1 Tax=Streptomyces mashuensis TaxID=33904 RepID=A0A919EG21_9ACTN|nr:alpha/beta hydrolase [Streptomyces mashuensis]GHF71576.1 alpha/beta hydrolase [Streptomyces mashuensis]